MKIVAYISFVSEDGRKAINLTKEFESQLVPMVGGLFLDEGLLNDAELVEPRLIESVTLDMLTDTYEIKLKDYLLPLHNENARAENMKADRWEIMSFIP